jgi:hypothetical protein
VEQLWCGRAGLLRVELPALQQLGIARTLAAWSHDEQDDAVKGSESDTLARSSKVPDITFPCYITSTPREDGGNERAM